MTRFLHIGSGALGWAIEPLPALAILGLGLAYGLGLLEARRRDRARPAGRRVAAFYLGLSALAVALAGPLEDLSQRAFAAHMLQHLLLLQLAPPLIWLGRPAQLALAALPSGISGALVRLLLGGRGGRSIVQRLQSPWFIGLAFNLNLIVWHLPPLYDAALRSQTVHVLEHLGFLSFSLLLWWILLEPVGQHHRASAHAVYALCFASWSAGMLVSLALLFAPYPLYPWYTEVLQPWGLDPLTDQRLSGIVMAAGGLAYVAMLFSLLSREVEGSLDDPADLA